MFYRVNESKEDTIASKILPAVRYLREHFAERVDCSELAGLCFLGTSQFYKLFTEAMNKTPLEYRNSLIIARAKQLLSLGEGTVSEIAFSLGFDSVAYFSRMFKKRGRSLPHGLHTKRILHALTRCFSRNGKTKFKIPAKSFSKG